MTETTNLDQLKCFIAAYESGSFSAAARKLGKGQSVVSTHVQNMEVDLNLCLFDRSTKHPTPTKAADALITHARQVIAQANRFQQVANSYQKGHETELRIIFEELVMPDKLNEALAAFAENFPFTQLISMTAVGEEVIKKVAQGNVDFAFITSQESYPDDVDFINLGNQKVLMLISPDHPLANHSAPSLSVLSNHRQIITSTANNNNRWRIASQIWSCDTVQQTLELASRGVGWANAPPELASPYLKSGRLIELNLTNARHSWTLGVDLLWSSRTPKGLAAQWFSREAGRLYGNYYHQPIGFTDRT